jgi:uncharacterized surface protein with fasciclin (FAS1) repeats/subtilisin family serine protease
MIDETPVAWFVELAGAPVADGGSKAYLDAQKAAFRAAAQAEGLEFDERFAFSNLWNGLSIAVDVADIGVLQRLPGVTAVYPVEVIQMPEPEQGASPELFTALQMTGADIAQSELGYTGEGVKVAVMDTGIDVDHPDFGGDGVARYDSPLFPSARIAYGYDFVGDDFNADDTAPSYNPVPSPDPNPDDCAGHGTHVAGIVGANGKVVGVAPEVTFGAYRVFGCEGSTTADIMIAAMEMALADGMDVLNMSIGSAYQWPQYPTAVAASRLVNKGMVVVASIGNSGANGLYSAGAPGLGKNVIGVASYDNVATTNPVFEVNGTDIGYIPLSYSGPVPTSGTEEIVYVGLACNANLPLLADPVGKVALAVRGACSFGEKATNAINAGATAVVIYNSSPGNFSGTLGAQIGDGSVPVVSIAQADGNFIVAQTAPVSLTWTDRLGSFPSVNGGLISSFSSYGLSPDLALKPDIGAPGGNIYSTYPLEEGGYATLGGTSMASPHVAGAAALLLEAKPNTPAKRVKAILQNSADPALWWGNPGLGYLDNVHRQGAGMVDVDDAILAQTRVEPSALSLGEYGNLPNQWLGIYIYNQNKYDVTYSISYVNALSTGGVITPSFWDSDAELNFNIDSVPVSGRGGYGLFTVNVTPPTYPANGVYGGYIIITPDDGSPVITVPFAGYQGDYQEIQVLTPTANGFPWLSALYGGSYNKITDPDQWVFSLQNGDYPYFLVHFDHQSRLLQMEVFNAKTGKSWRYFVDESYMPRNSTPTSFFAFPFDGNTFRGKKTFVVPDGEYFVKISVLKANGYPSLPEHWEVWTSPNFVIDREAKDIVEIAVADGRFTTLAAALGAANLVDVLKGPGPFTVFAPTDDAFDKLPAGTIDELLKPENLATLQEILLYHVVPGKVTSDIVVTLSTADTAAGIPVRIQVIGGKVFINDAEVIITDIMAKNGVIHVIDTVLLPPMDIVDTAVADGRFTTLAAALGAADLVDTLKGPGPFTVFAPTDDAFAKLPAGTIDELLKPENKDTLTAILLYHVAPGFNFAADVVNLTTITTVGGGELTVTIDNGKVFINDAEVIITDIFTRNGVIHVIDTVLIPPAP